MAHDFFYNAIGYTYDNQRYHNSTGDDGNENNFDFEPGDAPPEGEIGIDMPKYRQMVKAKKLEFNSKYGRGYWTTRDGKKKYPPQIFIGWNWKWTPGWRRKWKEFKASGGLKAIKLACKTGDTSAMSTKGIMLSQVNPFTNRTESHTPAEWQVIFDKYNRQNSGGGRGSITSTNNDSVISDTGISSTEEGTKILGMKPVVIYIILGVLVLGVVGWIFWGKKISK
jgi:hypothetical protein